MRLNNEPISFDTTDLSGNAVGEALYLGQTINGSVQLNFTGTALIGAFKIQASNDTGNINAASEAAREASITNWTDIAGTSTAVNLTGNSSALYELQNVGYNFIRVIYTATSGVGALTNARFVSKGF